MRSHCAAASLQGLRCSRSARYDRASPAQQRQPALASLCSASTIFSIVRDVGYLMDSINTSTAMHRLGKVSRRHRGDEPGMNKRVVAHPCYQLLVQRIEDLVPEYKPRGLANTMWGLAGEQVAQSLAFVGLAVSVSLPPAESLASLPAGAALGDVAHLGLAERLARAIASHSMDEYRSQELSNVVWALGTLGVVCEPVLDRLLQRVVDQIDTFIPQALSNMVWACAHLRNGTRGCNGAIAGGGTAVQPAREPRATWAPSPDFLAAVAGVATRKMSNFQSQARAAAPACRDAWAVLQGQ